MFNKWETFLKRVKGTLELLRTLIPIITLLLMINLTMKEGHNHVDNTDNSLDVNNCNFVGFC